MTSHQAFRRLNRAIDNPVYDRRCKHGIESVISFPAGMPFVHRMGAHPCNDAVLTINDRIITSPQVVDALVDASSHSNPRTWREAALDSGDTLIADQYGGDVIDALIESGIVSIADVANAIAAVRAKWDEEEAA